MELSNKEKQFLYDYLKMYDMYSNCYENTKEIKEEQSIVLNLIKKLDKEMEK